MPAAILCTPTNEVILGHDTDPARYGAKTSLSSYFPAVIGYMALGTTRSHTWNTLKNCLHPSCPSFSIPAGRQPDEYRALLLHELASIRHRLQGVMAATLPLWLAADGITTFATPPGTETVGGAAITYVVSKLWLRRIRTLEKALHAGRTETFSADPLLTEAQNFLDQGEYGQALRVLAGGNGQADRGFPSATLGLAEGVLLAERHKDQGGESVSERLRIAVADFGARCKRLIR